MQHPEHDLPAAIVISGGFCLLLPFRYPGDAAGIASRPDQPGAWHRRHAGGNLWRLGVSGAVVKILGAGVLATFFATMVTWTLGTNRSATKLNGEDAARWPLARLDPVRKTPIGATLIGGVISTLVLVAYGALPGSNDQYFWSLFAFASIVFLLPYLLLFPVFLSSRRSRPGDQPPLSFPRRHAFSMVRDHHLSALRNPGNHLLHLGPGSGGELGVCYPSAGGSGRYAGCRRVPAPQGNPGLGGTPGFHQLPDPTQPECFQPEPIRDAALVVPAGELVVK